MLIVIALIIGLVGGWMYAGCPLPRGVLGVLSSRRPLSAERPTSEVVSPAPAPGASTARP
jgi:hypothetical protein